MKNELSAALHRPAWFCVRTRTKQELQTAITLQGRVQDIETYAPRIRYRKNTRRGRVWFVEALFPGYLFARFVAAESLRAVRYAPGVTGIVAFGGRLAIVPDEVIERLRSEVPDREIRIVDEPYRVGEVAEIVEGPFRGLEAVIVRVMPAKERVRLLLDFLGRQTEVEVGCRQLAKPVEHPLIRPDHAARPLKRRVP